VGHPAINVRTDGIKGGIITPAARQMKPGLELSFAFVPRRFARPMVWTVGTATWGRTERQAAVIDAREVTGIHFLVQTGAALQMTLTDMQTVNVQNPIRAWPVVWTAGTATQERTEGQAAAISAREVTGVHGFETGAALPLTLINIPTVNVHQRAKQIWQSL